MKLVAMSKSPNIKLLKKRLLQLAHRLRNAVSAADGVIGDRVSGFTLTDDDFSDARKALEKVKVLIDELDEVSETLEADD